ncbi:DUF1573 domain-containing protein [Raineya orbicola]|jgi:hypothetical protein|uniref:DUF1573 domain-containing protein n=1 Tax=Raineya orbicola TaxID=2016530 RepID=A0A2N3IJR8_9BACT|nr:DUF1573 domain-containing protein [Raineya orbicola]PKQ70483.1 hypothetical protein Rain11_0403 [Raineya orbicola]
MKKNKPFGNPFGFLSIMLLCISFGYAQPSSTPTESQPQIAFEKTVHDFGEIPQGTPVTTTFTFTNKGKTPITISNVQASCGCTTPSYTREPIAPKKKGEVTATYNAAAVGEFNKTVAVFTNTGTPITLTLKGKVVAKPQTQP